MQSLRARSIHDAPAPQATDVDVSSWQARMRRVVLDTVDETEIREVLLAVLDKAKKGDLQAARLILSYAVGSPPRRESDSHPGERTGAAPGSPSKLDVLAYRRAHGLPLHVADDGPEIDLK